MKTSLIPALLLLPSMLTAQSFFSIKGYGKLLKDGDSIFLGYKQNDKFLLDSTVVKSNAFEFRGVVYTAVKGYICRKDNPRFAELLMDACDVYIEPGLISVQSSDSLLHALITGTPLNNDNAILEAMLQPVKMKGEKVRNPDRFTPYELKDTALVNGTRQQLLDLYNERVAVQLSFIKQHPASYVSLVTLAGIARNSRFIPQVEQIYPSLSTVLKEMPQGKDIEQRIRANKKITIGMLSPDFIQPDVHGKPVKLSDFKGKYVLVDFWASWCGPCREENPNVLMAYERYKHKNFTVLSVSIDVLRDKEKWLKAVKEDKLPWVQVSDLKKENEAAKLYGVTTIPANVLIDPSGKVIAKDLKGKALLEMLATLPG